MLSYNLKISKHGAGSWMILCVEHIISLSRHVNLQPCFLWNDGRKHWVLYICGICILKIMRSVYCLHFTKALRSWTICLGFESKCLFKNSLFFPLLHAVSVLRLQCLVFFVWLLYILNSKVNVRALQSIWSTIKVYSNKFQFVSPLGDKVGYKSLYKIMPYLIWVFGSTVSVYCKNQALSEIAFEIPLGSEYSLETVHLSFFFFN